MKSAKYTLSNVICIYAWLYEPIIEIKQGCQRGKKREIFARVFCGYPEQLSQLVKRTKRVQSETFEGTDYPPIIVLVNGNKLYFVTVFLPQFKQYDRQYFWTIFLAFP